MILCYIWDSLHKIHSSASEEAKVFSHLKESLKVLSSPPKYSTVRVNLHNAAMKGAMESLVCHLNSKSYCIHKKESDIFPHPLLPDLMIVKSHGKRNVIPRVKEVIVGHQCGAAVLRGAEVYAPGVLGATSGFCVGEKVAVYVDLDNKCLRGSKVFKGRKMFVGNGTTLKSRSDLFRVGRPLGVAVAMEEKLFDYPSLGDLNGELFFVQNLPSVICSHVLKPEKDGVVLDMCAAPGGKTTHLASLVGSLGRVIAIDRSKRKIEQVMENAEKLGLGNICTFVHDSTKLLDDSQHSNSGEPQRSDGFFESEASKDDRSRWSPPYLPSSFRWILLDAPCSALGQRPQILTKCSLKELKSFPVIQRRLLENAVQLLKCGGTLVYSTCSIVPDENEKMVKWVLDTFQDVELIDSLPKIGQPGLPNCGLSSDQCKKVQRFGPLTDEGESTNVTCNEFDRDTIGFFIASFTKL